MQRRLFAHATLALLAAPVAVAPARADTVAVGRPAPDFRLVDTSGRTVSLADHRGRHVVLEWVNPGCPFVQKHYQSGNLPATQRKAVGRGVVWLAVQSTDPTHRDHHAPAALAAWMAQHQAAATATLMDLDGRVGRAYGARVTPHLYVVDADGRLVYAGGIDDKPTARIADIATATNHVDQALADLLAGRAVGTPVTKPYGCAIKYPD